MLNKEKSADSDLYVQIIVGNCGIKRNVIIYPRYMLIQLWNKLRIDFCAMFGSVYKIYTKYNEMETQRYSKLLKIQ